MRPGLALRKVTDNIVIHCSASVPSLDTDVDVIDRWHRGQGYLMVGYHFVIKTDGEVQAGRPMGTIGAHVGGYNHNSLGICLVGGVDAGKVPTNNFTAEQFAALHSLCGRMQLHYPKARILGHRDFPGVRKACPSFDAGAWASQQGLQ